MLKTSQTLLYIEESIINSVESGLNKVSVSIALVSNNKNIRKWGQMASLSPKTSYPEFRSELGLKNEYRKIKSTW